MHETLSLSKKLHQVKINCDTKEIICVLHLDGTLNCNNKIFNGKTILQKFYVQFFALILKQFNTRSKKMKNIYILFVRKHHSINLEESFSSLALTSKSLAFTKKGKKNVC